MASDLNGDGRGHSSYGQEPTSPVLEMAAPLGNSNVTVNPESVNKVMYSEIGINVLLNRLKQSITSAREFTVFLNKRARLEEKHAQGLKEMSRATVDAMHRPDARQGTFTRQMGNITLAHEHIAEHETQFANSLSQMHNDLTELLTNMERERKRWKQEGTNNEKKVKDAELLMDKAKSRYDSLAEDYDRARTGDKSSGRVFTVKGPKSAEKHEEDLHRKLQSADNEYASKVQAAQSQRQENMQTSRPQAVKALQELIRECDSALTLQLQKYAAFSEKLLVMNGLEISPVKNDSGPPKTSLREMIQQINNEDDFNGFISSHASTVPNAPADLKYQKHPLLAPTQQIPQQQQVPHQPPQVPTQRQSAGQSPAPSQPQPPSLNTSIPTSTPFGASQPPPSQPQQSSAPRAPSSPPQLTQPPHGSNLPYGQQAPQQAPPPQQNFKSSPPQQYQSPMNGAGMSSYPPPGSVSGPYAQRPPQQGPPPAGPNGRPTSRDLPPPTKPVFGVTLDELFHRDDLAVPMVVLQCIQAVDLFGLEVEGIYRLSGNAQHINQLRAAFDNDSSRLDFRNPEVFHHDVNSVAGLLKQFFRELPDPLFTAEHYTQFIEAARIDDDIVRRDSIHGVINALPDPNYATIRAVVLHLNRVQEHAQANRMSTQNLAICFAPTLMGQHTGPHMADAGLQARVLDTILQNTYQIFDDD